LIIKDSDTHLDSKGRLLLSKAEYSELDAGERGIIVRMKKDNGFILYTKEEWNQLAKKGLRNLKGIKFRRATRVLFGTTFVKKVDKRRRVQIRKGGRDEDFQFQKEERSSSSKGALDSPVAPRGAQRKPD